MAMISCQSFSTASGSAVKALRRLMPALLTRIDTGPTLAVTSPATAKQFWRSVTSSPKLSALPPSPRISSAAFAAAASSISRTTTRAPSRAKPAAIARPMPDAPPVTAAMWSWRSGMVFPLLLVLTEVSKREGRALWTRKRRRLAIPVAPPARPAQALEATPAALEHAVLDRQHARQTRMRPADIAVVGRPRPRRQAVVPDLADAGAVPADQMKRGLRGTDDDERGQRDGGGGTEGGEATHKVSPVWKRSEAGLRS